MGNVRRIFVEKKPGFDIEARHLLSDLKAVLGLDELKKVRILHRYDIADVSEEVFQKSLHTIFSEPPVDFVYSDEFPLHEHERVFAMEYLPGQYDQRADSAAQCVQILAQSDRPKILTAKVIVLEGNITDEDFARIKNYCINPVDSREASFDIPESLELFVDRPRAVEIVSRFIDMNEEELSDFHSKQGFAMSTFDLKFCQQYFKNDEKRNPTITELKVIDTYWSDHCRHTTFLTKIEEVVIEKNTYSAAIENAYQEYLQSRKDVYGEKERDITLMDIATIAMKELSKKGMLNDLEESEEINACSIIVEALVNGKPEEWLVMFKNETHNHPTEIEPFGGAATCLGGAIRDPLSGRAYVYQAMRVTGSGDPRAKIEDTLPGKLPQRKITTGAAAGYSSYGNQIGLATGHVAEIYDEGYIAKRMEIGAVIAAAPRKNVVRGVPEDGDVVILLGGRTGRDGCGGATGSSKEHTEESIFTCGAEVQKGNPPTERKIQRLFRNPDVSTMIKKCNDFGAGGVSVAIGELAPGLEINLDAVPKKYEGLDGTELAISESQERMAVVVSAQNAEKFINYAKEENLEATVVAKVTAARRLKMNWHSKPIVDISRDFLDTNGVKQHAKVKVLPPDEKHNIIHELLPDVENSLPDIKKAWLANISNLNVASQKGLIERFDSTIGAGTVLMPFGGKYQDTPAECMVAKIPVVDGETNTCTIMAHGYNPRIAKWSPFHAAMYAVVEAVSKVVAVGGDYQKIRLTLQEYFEKLYQEPTRWGKPFSALLGAFYAQKQLGIPAIGGKDSMSGTFKNLDVPPTLVAFAVGIGNAEKIISPEFKYPDSQIVLIPAPCKADATFDFAKLSANFAKITELIHNGKVISAHTVKTGGIAEAVTKMCFGNRIGAEISKIESKKLFMPQYGSFVVEIPAGENIDELFNDISHQILGKTLAEPVIKTLTAEITLEEALAVWQQPLNEIFPAHAPSVPNKKLSYYEKQTTAKSTVKLAKPRIFMPVFPGTNCEYDTARAFEKAGGIVKTLVFKNLTALDIEETLTEMIKEIQKSQIIVLPGGFSAGDEPDGSGKFIATVFRNPRVKEAVTEFLKMQDGLMLGICNGFQALVKLGLVPYGEIRDMHEVSPTLTFNTIGRHISKLVETKVISNLSPWFANTKPGDTHVIAISHGEGRFVASEEELACLEKNGQIATQYVGENPNGSLWGIEGITSPDGRVLGKMGHSERIGNNLYKNVPGEKDQQLFASGIAYFA